MKGSEYGASPAAQLRGLAAEHHGALTSEAPSPGLLKKNAPRYLDSTVQLVTVRLHPVPAHLFQHVARSQHQPAASLGGVPRTCGDDAGAKCCANGGARKRLTTTLSSLSKQSAKAAKLLEGPLVFAVGHVFDSQ